MVLVGIFLLVAAAFSESELVAAACFIAGFICIVVGVVNALE